MPVDITDVDAFTDPISRPVDGVDLRTADSLASLYQGLSNRTRNLKNRIDNIGTVAHTWSEQNQFSDLLLSTAALLLDGSSEIYYSAGFTPTPRTRVRMYSAIGAIGFTGVSAITPSVAAATTNRQVFRWVLNDLLPTGSVVTRIRVLLAPGDTRAARSGGTGTSGDGGRMYIRSRSFFPSYSSPSFGTATLTVLEEDDGTTAAQVIDISPTWSVDNNNQVRVFEVVAGDNAGAENDAVGGIEITFSDLGPGRNY